MVTTQQPKPVFDPVTGALAVALGGGAAAAVAAHIIVQLAVGLTLSFLSKALGPKGDEYGTSAQAGLLVNGIDPAAAHEIVYGRVRKGGTVVYRGASGASNRYHHMVIAIAGHEVADIGTVYLNDQPVDLDVDGFVTAAPWNGKVRIKKHLGHADQVVDPDLDAEVVGDANFRLRGVAYLYARLDYDQNVFAGGIPLITAVVDGRKVYDPRTSEAVWSANAALCIRDFVTADFGVADAQVDDVLMQVAANVCEEPVALVGGGTEPRYEINGVISTGADFGSVLQDMLTACAGSFWWGQGAWRLKPGYYSPPVITLGLDDMRGPIRTSTRVNMRDNFSAVQGTFNDADQDWITADYPQVASAAFLDEDNGEERTLDFSLPLTTSSAAGQRIAKMALYRGREQISVAADVSLKALELQVGDVVALDVPFNGWDSKPFEVTDWALSINGAGGDLRVSVGLRETSAAAFDWDAEEASILSNNTSLLSYTDVPAIGISVEPLVLIIREKVTSVFRVSVSSGAASQVSSVEVEYRESGGADWRSVGAGDLGTFEVIDVDLGVYDFRARAINGFGFKGDWIVRSSIPAAEDTTPPGDVLGFAAEVSGRTIALQWEAVTDFDLSFYRIRHAVEAVGSAWANATTAVDKVPRPATSVTVPARPGAYFIRAYDKSGYASTAASKVVVSVDELEVFSTKQQQVESPGFAGARADCSVDGSDRLRITDPSSAPSLATYDFYEVIDTGAVRQVRAVAEVAVERIDGTLGLFDDQPGNFDDAPGLFDDLGGASQFADCDVQIWVSITDDDPAGSPTWQDYKRLRAADLFGRAFRFRATLTSASANVTPGVSALSAKLEYN